MDTVVTDNTKPLHWGWRIAIYIGLLIVAQAIISLPAALFVSPELLNGVFYVTVVLVTFIVLRFVDRRPFHAIGFSLHSRLSIELVQGFLLGFVILTVVFLMYVVLGYINPVSKGLSFGDVLVSLLSGVIVFTISGFGEELLFRGYVFQTLIEGTNRTTAVVVTSLLFGIAHLANPNTSLFAVMNVVLAGVLFSIAYLKTQTLWFPSALHISWNFFEGCIYSFPVSGLYFEKRLLIVQQTGPAWITGGTFGPEGGVIAVMILLTATMFILQTKAIRPGKGVWQLSEWKQREMTGTTA
jgi:membrane protease YdiL (CAAX protease family)